MSKEDVIVFFGTVVELLKDAIFLVKITNDDQGNPVSERNVLCHPSGKIRKNRIRIGNFDKVKVEFSSYSLDKGRIVERLKN